MSGIFPMIQPQDTAALSETLPLCREVDLDETGAPRFSAGLPVEVTGAEAVRVWCWKALQTPRFRHEAYTWDYGCEVDSLIGQAYTAAVKQSEAIRYVREALLPNPYVTAVRQAAVEFSGDRLRIDCAIETIYGEVTVHV